ncbi:SGNH/GDSL hydrolase family protein [Spiroplasma sp. DGKH1]|uniref:SGNH/GDSL hydrolase family protein n=1 Tax=Spiroplasma sp. DGKH1 TaxID=3050074 RepID=UPI0034C67614
MKKPHFILTSIITAIPLLLNPFSSSYNHDSYRNLTYSHLYVLGDSLSDTGGLVGAGTDFFKGKWFLPQIKAITFDSPFYNHVSFSNGPVAVQYLADQLHLSLTPGWKYSAFWNTETFEQYGNNYAIGGADIGDVNTWTGYFFANRFELANQLQTLLLQHTIQPQDLIVVEGGNNDLFAAIGLKNSYEQQTIITTALSSEEKILRELIANHAAHIIVTNVPDMGKTPSYYQTPLEQTATNLATEYNNQWSQIINKLQHQYPHKIKTYNLFNAFNKYRQQFAAQGFNVTEACIKENLVSVLYSGHVKTTYINNCNPHNINNYFFFDDVHPTALVHKMVGLDLYNLALNW